MLKLIVLFLICFQIQAEIYHRKFKTFEKYPLFYNVKPPKCNLEIDYTNVPGSCVRFRRCSNGYMWILNCPENTVWDNKSKTCADKSQVTAPCGTLVSNPTVYPAYLRPAQPRPVFKPISHTTQQFNNLYSVLPVYPIYPIKTTTKTITKKNKGYLQAYPIY
ncbi:unnamed protein product [Brachionus calyciflorus]|uniref:Chitin-binding type-2 domain-containing protein n=1 Tax=Brachionus calyciflorus TaxID=104777 RepID=A0A813MAD5_9BILA|nr:unnamed protein product [Brachionus calyciflorus]